MSIPDMSPEKGPAHSVKQSRFPHAPQTPCTPYRTGAVHERKVIGVAETVHRGLGKSVFDRIYIFSPSVGSSFEDGTDETWTPVKRLIETQLIDRANPMHSREQYFFNELDKETMEKLANIIDLQFKMIELSRKHGRKKEPQIAICLDDVSDNPRFSKNPLLTKLYSRGRHANITTVCSVHRSRGILNPVVRSQVTGVLFVTVSYTHLTLPTKRIV